MRKAMILMVVLMMVPVSAFAITNSTIECFDSDVLEENISITVDGNVSTLSLYTKCPNGCDNVTNSCEPLEYEQMGMNMLILIVIIVGMWGIYKFARSRA